DRSAVGVRSSAPKDVGRTQLITACNVAERSPLHDVRQPASRDRGSTRHKFRCMDEFEETVRLRRIWLAEPKPRSGEGWWSQTESNRRPPACKAGALPTELWPLQGSGIRSQVSGSIGSVLISDT